MRQPLLARLAPVFVLTFARMIPLAGWLGLRLQTQRAQALG